jgi:hypothetical protein
MEDYYTHTSGFGTAYVDLYQSSKDTGEAGNDLTRNGTYSTPLFTAKAIEVVKAHAADHADKPLFLYFPLQVSRLQVQ